MKSQLTAIALMMMSLWAAAGETNHVIRLSVTSDDADGTQVNMTVPLSLLYSFEDVIREALTEIKIEEHGIDLREIWNAVKDAGPTDFVEILEGETTVKISTSQTHIVVATDGDGDESVNAMIPFELCDALFTDSEDFDFENLMTVLEGMSGTDIVNVESDDENVRIWIE